MLEHDACPCGSKKTYETCCGVFHQGTPAPTPEALMRSRYVAFVQANLNYLQETWHATTRPQLNLQGNPEWVQLQVIESWQRGVKGFVHFRAFYKDEGSLQMMEEKSNFVRENERWFYLEPEQI